MSLFNQIGGLIVILIFMVGLMTIGAVIQYKLGWPWFKDEQGRQRFAFGKKSRR